MNFSKQIKRYGFYIVAVFLAVLTVSCGDPAQPEGDLAQIADASTPVSPVEYGASLGEWEEATQSDPTLDTPRPTPTLFSDNALESETESSQSQDAYPAPETAITPTEQATTTPLFTLDNVVYEEVMWDALIPAEFTSEVIMAKYADRLDQLEDGSTEGYEVYAEMQEEFNNAPVNEVIDGALIRLPGFIAPLEYTDDLITEFLLVPYFGACIHVPPPPANQTVLVKTDAAHGIKIEDSYNPIWVMGMLTTDQVTTELAEAGYYMENAIIEPYSELP